MTFKLGIISDLFKLPAREGIIKAKELGADGVQIYAVKGEVCPENMSNQARVKFKEFVKNQEIEISALCGDLGGFGFRKKDKNIKKIEYSKSIVDLAKDLGTNIVTTHIGVIPQDRNSEIYHIMKQACIELGDYAKSKGITFAIETGPEPAITLKEFLDDVDNSGIGVNLDPANLVMVTNDDPVKAVVTLKDYIVHTHAKDGIQYQPCNPEAIYEAFAIGGFAELEKSSGKLFRELPLGEGTINWEKYLKSLRDINYSGYLTIEREVGDNPIEDIKKALEFLKQNNSKLKP